MMADEFERAEEEDTTTSITLNVLQKEDNLSNDELEAHVKYNTKRLLEMTIKTVEVLYSQDYMREFQIMALTQCMANFCIHIHALSSGFRSEVTDRSLVAKAIGLNLMEGINESIEHAEREIAMANEMAVRGVTPGPSPNTIN